MLLKDLYSVEFLQELSGSIRKYYSPFDEETFINECLNSNWQDLKLMERSDQIVHCMHQQFPKSFKASAEILQKIGPSFTGLAATCLPNYVSKYGLDDWKTSVDLLYQLTRYSSAEFAIRPFLIKYPEKTEKIMQEWSTSDNVDVRRLASEGIRPRLPWGIRLKQYIDNPRAILPILNNLIFDNSEYVQKSVANNLNDISKDNPDVVIDFAKKYWHQKESSDWVITRGLRTLFKQGQPDVLKLLGYDPMIIRDITDFSLIADKSDVNLGEISTLAYKFFTGFERSENIYIGYRVHYIRQNKNDSYKDFFIKKAVLKPETLVEGTLKIKWRQLTTRKLYKGIHKIDLLINTEVVKSIEINLNI